MTSNVSFSAVTNPVYSKADNSSIDCIVTVSEDSDHQYAGQTHPFTCVANDPMSYGADLWVALQSGAYGAIGAYVAPTLTPQQLAQNAFKAGIALTSTGTSALNATYPIDFAAQAKVNGIVTCIIINGTFPNGETTLNWFDIEGNPHLFPDITTFKNFANAFVNFVTPLDEYLNSNGSTGSIPNNAITIA